LRGPVDLRCSALVGALGPVHPGGVLGEVGVEMERVEREKDSSDEEKQKLDSAAGCETERRR
jgi:hypothetical protein